MREEMWMQGRKIEGGKKYRSEKAKQPAIITWKRFIS